MRQTYQRVGSLWCPRRSVFCQPGLRVLILSLPCLLQTFLLNNRTQAEDWNQFRGPNSSGVSQSDLPLPAEFSSQKNHLWTVKLGDGIASPVITRGRVFTTAMTGDEEFSVIALDAETGKQFWKTSLKTGKLPRTTPPNSHASSTPASDGERVYTYFSTIGLVAMDAANGQELWRYTMPVPAYLMDWGAASSPIVVGDMVVFCQDDDLSPALFAIDARTGKLRWKTDRPDMLAGYSIPVLCEAGGRTDLVVAGSGQLKGYEPATGKELWTCNTLVRTLMTSPVVRDGIIYIAVQSYGDEKRTLKFALLEWLDTNQDGILARDEVPTEFHTRFDQSDRDGNGKIDETEIETAFQSAKNLVGGGTTIQAVRGGGSGDVTKTHLIWNVKNKSPSNLSSPLVVGQQLFVVKKGGLSSSFDIADGEPHWELNRIRNIGDYFGSPVAGDGKIYVPGENGFVVVLEQGPKLKVLSKNDIGEVCLASPAIADGKLFLRGRESMFCFAGEKSP
jgi:outer membrane protein assembly factor BamB